MSEKEKESIDSSRAKFLAALEKKKKKSGSGNSGGPTSGSKVGGQDAGGAPKRFQRKSGSA